MNKKGCSKMKYIVNTGQRKIVHFNDNVQPACRIMTIHPNQMEMTDEDYTKKYPAIYTYCPHCQQK